MANEAYRAVFLRVHPTGKMVLSLTTEADGKEAEYAPLVADELGVPALDVKVVPADTDRFGVGHGFNTAPSAGAGRGDLAWRRPRSATRGSCSRAWRSSAEPESLHVVERRLGERRRQRSGEGQDDRRHRALRARHRARCRPASRADSTRRPSTATERQAGGVGVDRDLDLVDDLERAEQRRVGLDLPLGLLDRRDGAEPPAVRRTRRRSASGPVVPRSVSSPSTRSPSPAAAARRSSGT